MKISFICSLLIAFSLTVCIPSGSLAQNGKPGKKEKTEQPTKTKKVVLPSTPEPPASPVPPGQVGMNEPYDKTQGYEKTGDQGEKEGWDKEQAEKEHKAATKEMRKAEKKRNKELRKAKRLREKEQRKLSRANRR